MNLILAHRSQPNRGMAGIVYLGKKMGRRRAIRKPRWCGIPLRVAVVTLLLSMLSFALSLLRGLVGTVLAATLRGGTSNVARGHRNITAPVAAVDGRTVGR